MGQHVPPSTHALAIQGLWAAPVALGTRPRLHGRPRGPVRGADAGQSGSAESSVHQGEARPRRGVSAEGTPACARLFSQSSQPWALRAGHSLTLSPWGEQEGVPFWGCRRSPSCSGLQQHSIKHCEHQCRRLSLCGRPHSQEDVQRWLRSSVRWGTVGRILGLQSGA